MKNVLLICQKELKGYFASPIAYLLMAFFGLIFGFGFFTATRDFVRFSFQAQMMGQQQPMNVNDQIIRPLLDASRSDLQAYLKSRGHAWVDDESNEDLDNPRNRIRHSVLPELNRAYPSATNAIARTAGVAREDSDWLDEVSRSRHDALVTRSEDGVQMDAAALLAEPPPIRRRIVLMALRCAVSGHEVGLEHVEAVLAVAARESGGVDVPGGRVELRREKLVLLVHSR